MCECSGDLSLIYHVGRARKVPRFSVTCNKNLVQLDPGGQESSEVSTEGGGVDVWWAGRGGRSESSLFNDQLRTIWWEVKGKRSPLMALEKISSTKRRTTSGHWCHLWTVKGKVPDFVITQGKFLRHRENIFDCIHWCKKHVSLHIFSKIFSLTSLGIISTFKYQYIYCPAFFLYHISYKYQPKLFRQFYNKIEIM